MFNLKDNKKEQKYEISNMGFYKLFIIRLLIPISYVLYGIIVSFFLVKAGFSNQMTLILLIIAYSINVPLSLSQNHLSFVERLHSFLAAPLINSMIVLKEPISRNRKYDNVLMKELENELKVIRLKFERLNYEKVLLYINADMLNFDTQMRK